MRCRSGMTFSDVVRGYGERLSLPPEPEGAGIWTLLAHFMREVRNGVTRVLILEHAEALDAGSLGELLAFTRLDQPHVMPLLLVASSAASDGSDASLFACLPPAITELMPIDRLEPEEVEAFILYQLNALTPEEGAAFAPETVRAIAAAAEGSAAAVNRLARQVLEGAASLASLPAPPEPDPPEPDPPLGEDQAPAESLPLLEPLSEVPARRRRRSPGSMVVGLYVAAASACGIVLLYLLLQHAPRPAPTPSVLAALAPAAGGVHPAAEANPPGAGTAASVVQLPAETAAAAPAVQDTPAPASQSLAPTTTDASSSEPQSPEPAPAPSSTALAPAPSPESAVEPAVPQDPAPAASPPAAVSAPAELPAAAQPMPAAPAAASVAEAEPSQNPAPAPVASPAELPAAAQPTPAAPALASEAEAESSTSQNPAPAPSSPAAVAAPAGLPASASAAEPSTLQNPAPAPSSPAPSSAPAEHPASAAVAEIEPSTPQSPLPAPPPAHAAPAAPDADSAALIRRGEQLLVVGDIVPARRFFERALSGGDAAAALGLGKTYDPLFLRRLGAIGQAGDAATAMNWYRRAAAAGNAEARARLERLGAAAHGGK